MPKNSYPLLDKVNLPTDLRRLGAKQLPQLAAELRAFLLHSVAQSGGHLASGLGVVELSIALHYVFDTPNDKIIWDVGHQSYPHKILTGRKQQLSTIKQKDGLAPFPKRSESEYDCFGTGHSSTSIGAALGMSLAAQLKGLKRHFIAVIGDGAMTAGMAYEALNHGGEKNPEILVILNQNQMSISKNTGALTKIFNRFAPKTPFKPLKNNLFTEMGFHHLGSIDGHNLPQLTTALTKAKQIKGAKILQINTRKGKGYLPAEQDPIRYHAVPPFQLELGLPPNKPPQKPTYSQVFGNWLCDMAKLDRQLIAITPAMEQGSGMSEFAKLFPDRFFDVGIAEQHAVTLAAGMACEGLKPVVAIYSTFLQRAYDQLIHDVAIQNLDVLFAIDRAGTVGADGATHAGNFDLSYLQCIPKLLIMAPADENETRQMLYTGYCHQGPAAVRYPREQAPGVAIQYQMQKLPIGKAKLLKPGNGKITILSFGSMLKVAGEAAEQLDAGLVNMRFIKPIDKKMIKQMAGRCQYLITIEDNTVHGGAGSQVNQIVNQMQHRPKLLNLGLPDQFPPSANRSQLLTAAGLDTSNLIRRIKAFCNQNQLFALK